MENIEKLQQAFRNRVALDDLVAERLEVNGDGHGLYTTYTNKGCRCEPCTVANRIYHRERRERLTAELGINGRVARDLGITGADASPKGKPDNKQGCKWCYESCWYCVEYSGSEHRQRLSFIQAKREKDGEFCQYMPFPR